MVNSKRVFHHNKKDLVSSWGFFLLTESQLHDQELKAGHSNESLES